MAEGYTLEETARLPDWARNAFAVSGVVTLVGSAIASLEESKMESRLLEHAAVMSEFDAQMSEVQTDARVLAVRKEGSKVVGAARTAAGASGFSSDSGSSLDAIEDVDRNLELNAEAMRAEGALLAGRIRSQSASLRAESRSVSTLGRGRAAATALSDARNIALSVL